MFTLVDHCPWFPVRYRNVVLHTLLLVSYLLNHPHLWIWNRIFHMVCKHSYCSQSDQNTCNNITSNINTIHNIILMYCIKQWIQKSNTNTINLFTKLLETGSPCEGIWKIPAIMTTVLCHKRRGLNQGTLPQTNQEDSGLLRSHKLQNIVGDEQGKQKYL